MLEIHLEHKKGGDLDVTDKLNKDKIGKKIKTRNKPWEIDKSQWQELVI